MDQLNEVSTCLAATVERAQILPPRFNVPFRAMGKSDDARRSVLSVLSGKLGIQSRKTFIFQLRSKLREALLPFAILSRIA